MIVPYNIATYRRADLPRVRLVNMYAEQTPVSRQQVALLTRPGMVSFLTLGGGPIRGMFASPGALANELFTVSGSSLYAESTSIGAIPGDQRVSMASSINQLLIANDTALYLSDGDTVETVDFPDGAGVSSVAFINGYFLAARTGTQRFYWSAILDGSSWDGLDYASAERSPDNIVAIWVVSDQIWIFGEVTTEIWVTTGDGEVPFQRVDGRLYDQGCLARDTIAKLDNSIFWVGHDFKVYRGDSIPMRVSDHAIEEAIQASDPANLRAWSFPWKGHYFYALATDRGTMVYDVASQQWTEFASYDRSIWRAHLGLFRDGEVLAGDDTDGTIWRLTDDSYEDNGLPLERRWTVLFANPIMLDNVLIDASSGEAPIGLDPICEMRMSRDGGNTFGEFRQSTVGSTGQYRKRIAFRRCGMIDGDGALLDFRLTDPTTYRVSSIRVNENFGGRGRPI